MKLTSPSTSLALMPRSTPERLKIAIEDGINSRLATMSPSQRRVAVAALLPAQLTVMGAGGTAYAAYRVGSYAHPVVGVLAGAACVLPGAAVGLVVGATLGMATLFRS